MERGSLLLPACEVNEEEERDGGGGGLKRTVQGRSSLRGASNVGRYKLARVGNGANTDRVEYGRIERDRGRGKKKGLELKGLTNTAASLLFFFLDNFFLDSIYPIAPCSMQFSRSPSLPQIPFTADSSDLRATTHGERCLRSLKEGGVCRIGDEIWKRKV